MTPEAQRIAIAKACPNLYYINEEGSLRWRNTGMNVKPFDPLHDLNAMHEAEKTLRGRHATEYAQHLDRSAERSYTYPASYFVWNCTAAQRAKAFLRTLNLWDDTK